MMGQYVCTVVGGITPYTYDTAIFNGMLFEPIKRHTTNCAL